MTLHLEDLLHEYEKKQRLYSALPNKLKGVCFKERKEILWDEIFELKELISEEWIKLEEKV